MQKSEVVARCEDVARATGIPLAWVLHHVWQRAGRPCGRCDGSGFVGVGVCFRCGGTGGKTSHAGVAAAVSWVEANVSRVRSLGERRDARHPIIEAERRHREVVAVETWKRDNADLWCFVEDMLPCDFKYSMLRAIEEGRLTPRQDAALRKLEASNRRADAPSVGSTIDVPAVITGARNWVDVRGRSLFRIDFWVAKGWGGRIETTDPILVARVQCRRTDDAVVRGSVVWSKETYAIVSGRVEIEFRMG